jgi:hypothetical protein
VLAMMELPMPDIAVSGIGTAMPAARRTVSLPPGGKK